MKKGYENRNSKKWNTHKVTSWVVDTKEENAHSNIYKSWKMFLARMHVLVWEVFYIIQVWNSFLLHWICMLYFSEDYPVLALNVIFLQIYGWQNILRGEFTHKYTICK